MASKLFELSDQFSVTAQTSFIKEQSDSKANRFVFAYTIDILNNSDTPAQLISRHWLIQDANQKTEEIYGDGVVGQQPLIKPGESYSYTSGAVLETEMGTMQGRYFLISTSTENANNEFEIIIPKFVLSVPRTLH